MKNRASSITAHGMIAATLSIMAACSHSAQQTGNDLEFPDIDVSENYPQETTYIQDIGEIEYIPLELTDSSMLGTPTITMTAKHFLTSNSEGNVIVYNRDGNLRNTFNHKGQSGTEYTYIDQLLTDPESEEVYVVDKMMSRVQKYDLDGRFLGTIAIPGNLFQDLFYLKDGTLLSIDRKNVADEDLRKQYGVNETPYLIIDDSGQPTQLPYRLKDPVSDLLMHSSGNSAAGISLWVAPAARIGSQVIISEASEDTIYAISDATRTPILAKHNTHPANGSPTLTAIDGINTRFVLIYALEKEIDMNRMSAPEPAMFIYDHKNPGWKRTTLANRDITDDAAQKTRPRYRLSASNHALADGYMAQVLSAETLCELRDNGSLTGALSEAAADLNEDSNPVLMLVRLKE